jgi:L-asparaginase II
VSEGSGPARRPPRGVEVTRGGVVESRHAVHAAASDGQRLLGSYGDAGWLTVYRSSSKVLQAFPLVRSGAADRYGLGPRELAVACGSHAGTAAHVEVVTGMLARAGLTVDHLQCGAHEPRDGASARALRESGARPTAAHHNCSGKHAGMLLRCRHEGWPVENYLDPGHPHQVDTHGVVAGYAGLATEDVPVVLDGCSAPVCAVPLSAMARSYALLAQGRGPDGAPSPHAGRLVQAILSEPDMAAGPGLLDTEFIRAGQGAYVGKIGAEGVYAAAHLPTGRGLAFKVEDGGMRAVPAALFDLLEALGWPVPPGLSKFARPGLTSLRGIPVGEIRPRG